MIRVYDSAADVAAAAAALVAWQVASQPASAIGLAGGSTPQATYRLLAGARLDWSDATLFLGDERWVPPTDEDSNTRMARTALGAAAERLEAPNYELGDPHAAAADYTERILPSLDGGAADLVLLGMGDDGHTASLFPGSAALDIDELGFAANWVEDKSAWRLTATLPLLCAARSLVFVVAGTAKADMLHLILEHEHPLPAQRVAACSENVTWLVDSDAASHLG